MRKHEQLYSGSVLSLILKCRTLLLEVQKIERYKPYSRAWQYAFKPGGHPPWPMYSQFLVHVFLPIKRKYIVQNSAYMRQKCRYRRVSLSIYTTAYRHAMDSKNDQRVNSLSKKQHKTIKRLVLQSHTPVTAY